MVNVAADRERAPLIDDRADVVEQHGTDVKDPQLSVCRADLEVAACEAPAVELVDRVAAQTVVRTEEERAWEAGHRAVPCGGRRELGDDAKQVIVRADDSDRRGRA